MTGRSIPRKISRVGRPRRPRQTRGIRHPGRLRRPRRRTSVLQRMGRRIAQAARDVGIAVAGVLLGVQIGYMLLILLASGLYRVVDPPISGLMMYRALVSGYQVEPVRFVPLEEVPREVQRMFVKVEDYTFYEHHGLDLQAIRDAYRLNRRLGRVYWGGSTITQQLARTLFLTPQRTYLRKYLEAIAALEMELVLPKRRILELYVNSIEFGKGIFGLGTAARDYYGCRVDQLTRDQARRLVALVASPIRYDVDNLGSSRALAERYRYLREAFP